MIAIVTDSTICITRAQAEALGLYIVPDSYSVRDRLFHEGFSDENGDFEPLIFGEPERCKTSQAPVSTFIKQFEELIAKDMDVLCLVISSRLSGTYSSACIAAREVDPRRVAVVDSLSTAGGLHLLAEKARELSAKGLSLWTLAERIEGMREQAGIVFSVDSMAALRRSGRIGIVPMSVGTVLNIRPILLCVRGTVVARGLVRGKAERLRALVSRVPENAKHIMIHYLGDLAQVESLRELLAQRFRGIDIRVNRGGPVLGIHLGTGALGVSWITV
ncbi:MAG: DegV family protein [Bacillota bacterium]